MNTIHLWYYTQLFFILNNAVFKHRTRTLSPSNMTYDTYLNDPRRCKTSSPFTKLSIGVCLQPYIAANTTTSTRTKLVDIPWSSKSQSMLEQQTSESKIHVLVLMREERISCLRVLQQTVFQKYWTISFAWSFSFSMDPCGFSSLSLISWLRHIECQQWRWGIQLFRCSILATGPQDCGTHHML